MEALPLLVLLVVVIAQSIMLWHSAGRIGQLDDELDHTHLLAHEAQTISTFALEALQAHLDGYDVKIHTDLDRDMPIRTEPEE